MFDKAVVPILLYGSEIWGFENLDLLESLHLKFCKHILHLKQSTPNFMVYGELGRCPLSIKLKVRMINFWFKLNEDKNKISSLLYRLLFVNYFNYGIENKWLLFIKSIFDDCGMSNMWNQVYIVCKKWLTLNIERKLKINFYNYGSRK